MTDSPSAIDPLVAQGPLAPVESLRPAPSLQRVLILDTPTPHMIDLAGGNVRPYENGPPVSIPMTSTRFDLASIERLQVQVLRDPRPTSADTTLFSLHLGDGNRTIDVRETSNGKLVIDVGEPDPMTTPIGESPAVVIVVTRSSTESTQHVTVSARNAETMEESSTTFDIATVSNAMVTIGGPTTEVAGRVGRRRTIPVQIHTAHTVEPVDQVRRVLRGAKRAAGSIRGRVG